MIGKRSRLLLTWLLFGYAFLYIPILSLVVYSFNESKAGDGLGRGFRPNGMASCSATTR